MNMKSLKHVVPAAMLGCVILLASACKTGPTQAKFATPDDAAVAVQHARDLRRAWDKVNSGHGYWKDGKK